MAIGVIHSVYDAGAIDGTARNLRRGGWIRPSDGGKAIHFTESVLSGCEWSTDLNEAECNVAVEGGEAIRVGLR